MLRGTVAVPCGEPSRRQRSRAHIGRKRRGKANRPDSCRGTTTREPASVPAATSSPRATIVEGMDIPATPIESLSLAERAFADRLVFLDQARRSAAAFTKGSAREV